MVLNGTRPSRLYNAEFCRTNETTQRHIMANTNSDRTSTRTDCTADRTSTDSYHTARTVTNIELVPVCVGVGDAIFVCIDYNYSDGTVTKHCYLVDGSLGAGGPDRIKELSGLSPGGKEQYKGITNLEVTPINNTDYLKLETTYRRLTTEGFVLKGIIVTHPDKDHYQGIRFLLQTHEINCPVLMTNRFLQERLMRNVDLSEFLQVLELTHIGKHVRENQKGAEHELVRLGFPKFFEFRHSETGLVIYTLRDQRYFPKRITERALNMPPTEKSLEPAGNNTSIVTTIRNPDNNEEVLAYLTGDAVLNNTVVKVTDYFRARHPCVFQVPHHGSSNNSGVVLYQQIADENPECIYFISCGTKCYGNPSIPFPHKQVLQNICTANKDNKSVRIILTSNRALNDTLMKGIQNSQVFIYYWDEHVHAHQPYLNILLSYSPINLALIPTLVEWTIDGYTKMIHKSHIARTCTFYLFRPLPIVRYWNLKDLDQIESGQFPLTKIKKKFLHGICNIPPPWSPSLWNSGNTIVLTNASHEILRGPIILKCDQNQQQNGTCEIFRCDQVTWRKMSVVFTTNNPQWTNDERCHDNKFNISNFTERLPKQ